MAAINLREQICGWARDEIERAALTEDVTFDVTMAAGRLPQGTNIVQYVLVVFMAHPLDSPLPLLGQVPLLGTPARKPPLTSVSMFSDPQPGREAVTQTASQALEELRQTAAQMLTGLNGDGAL
jgi:hypothetical protein